MTYNSKSEYAFVCSCGQIYKSKFIDRYIVENNKSTMCSKCGRLAPIREIRSEGGLNDSRRDIKATV